MPVAFRSVGTRLKADMTYAANPQTVTMPPGHAAGDLLLLFLVYDNNVAPTSSPSGWTLLGTASAGQSLPGASASQVQTRVYYRVATGTTSSASFSFSKQPWPTGSPYVLAFTAAYSGVDPAGPIEKWSATGTANTAATQVHPQLTTVASGDWLLTFRSGSAWQARTVTVSGGTNTERVDDTDGFGELFAALYDSGASLSAGAQTQRSTTSAGGDAICQGGSTMWSLALKPVTAAAATVALPGTATVSATAHSPTVQTAPGGWDLCAEEGLPVYKVGVDWNGDGTPEGVEELGDTWATDSFNRTVTDGWGTADTGQSWTSFYGVPSDFSVSSGVGRHVLSTSNTDRYTVLSPYVEDVDLAVDFSMDQRPANNHHFVFLFARLTSESYYYTRLQIPQDGSLSSLSVRKYASYEGETALAVSFPLALSPATWYRLRFRLTGQTLRAKVWDPAGPEPGWQVNATVTTGLPLTEPGPVGVRTNTSSTVVPATISFRNFQASDPADPEEVTEDIISDISVSYGRDQERQLNPAAVGSASFTLDNSDRKYSPENEASPLYGDLDPARLMRASVDFNGQTHDLFNGRIDDYNVHADYGDRTAEFTFLDALNDLSGIKLSTGVYASLHTGELINAVLDLVGWTGGRDIDVGASVVPYWWAEGTDALSAINELVKSEGPPAVAYVAPDNTFVFRDRHHRLMRTQSREVRATFTGGRLGDCTAGSPPATGYSFTKPFTYSHGWRDVVNSVTFDVDVRAPSAVLEAVWTDESTYHLAAGQSVEIEVTSSDPFVDAVTPRSGTDIAFTAPGGASVWTLLSRTSGASATLTLRAVGGPVTVTRVQLRARPLTVQRTVKVSLTDPGSVTRHGERSYPDSAPWASPADAEAIANMILLHYARRRPTVQLRVVSSDPAHFMQVLQRTVSDCIRIVNEEMGLDGDFFVERVTHTVQRTGRPGRAPVHSVVLGCEADLVAPDNVFRFDQRGAGFDQGVFDLTVADTPGEVFVFDDPVQGQFDRGRLGT
ncbi:hypothetical protein [Streptomyces sp. NRRL S-455]|uniref:hypothetical protein n=1 Tax=Streptomyces sp. NRRL S-455 TaxID=1463908 RepID=UPI0004BE9E36|nr:hypothetical protein [Streptomyces sp. NRRL S-455]